jgi:transcriptional repressor CTCF
MNITGNLMRHMTLHDPDSSVQEKAMALKYGRQKKIQIINGHQEHYCNNSIF